LQTLKVSEVQMTEKTGLLSGLNASGGGGGGGGGGDSANKEYGTISVSSPRTFAAPSSKPAPPVVSLTKPHQINTAAQAIEISVNPILKPVLRATSASKTTTDTDVTNILSAPQSARAKASTSKQEPPGLDLETGGGGSFVFKQPDAFPKRG
jgi:hypothetical protein